MRLVLSYTKLALLSFSSIHAPLFVQRDSSDVTKRGQFKISGRGLYPDAQ